MKEPLENHQGLLTHDKRKAHTGHMTSADSPQVPIHHFVVDLWPPNTDHRSYPLMIPDHVAVDSITVEGAFQQVTIPDGWTATLSSHNRARCNPPHPGRD